MLILTRVQLDITLEFFFFIFIVFILFFNFYFSYTSTCNLVFALCV